MLGGNRRCFASFLHHTSLVPRPALFPSPEGWARGSPALTATPFGPLLVARGEGCGVHAGG